MTHDPLCKAASVWVAVMENGGSLPDRFVDFCPTCDLIAKVRDDVLAKCIEAVELCTTDKGVIYRENETGVEWAMSALEALQEQP